MAAFAWTASAEARITHVAVGRDGAIAHLEDGETWEKADTPARGYINGVVSDNSGHFVAVGARGIVLPSADGVRWETATSGTEAILQAVAFDDEKRFVAVGDKGTVVYSVDGGSSWQPGSSGVEEALFGVATDREGAWVAVGVGGTALYSTDGGGSWAPAVTPTAMTLNDVDSRGGNTFVAVGQRGAIIASTDGGRTWTEETSGSKKILEGVAYNRVPDLALTALKLDGGCNIVATISNRGPAKLPGGAWDTAATLVKLETTAGALMRGLREVDPDKKLRAVGAQLPVTLSDAPLAPGQKIEGTATVDPDAVFAEVDERNSRQTSLECPAG